MFSNTFGRGSLANARAQLRASYHNKRHSERQRAAAYPSVARQLQRNVRWPAARTLPFRTSMVVQSAISLANETVNAFVSLGAALLLAPLAVLAYRTGGPFRLWVGWCLFAALVLAAYAELPTYADLTYSIPLFAPLWATVPVLATATAVHALAARKAPLGVQVPVACLLFFLALDIRMGTVSWDPVIPQPPVAI